MKVFLVDDDPFTIVLITHMLEKEDIRCECSLSFDDKVVNDIKKNAPDVIILDLMIGDKKASELIRKLKDCDILTKSQLIIISANHDLKNVVEYIKDSAIDFIHKPIVKDNLIHRVKQAGLISKLVNKLNEVKNVSIPAH